MRETRKRLRDALFAHCDASDWDASVQHNASTRYDPPNDCDAWSNGNVDTHAEIAQGLQDDSETCDGRCVLDRRGTREKRERKRARTDRAAYGGDGDSVERQKTADNGHDGEAPSVGMCDLPVEMLTLILKGRDGHGRLLFDPRWRFTARCVCRLWNAILSAPIHEIPRPLCVTMTTDCENAVGPQKGRPPRDSEYILVNVSALAQLFCRTGSLCAWEATARQIAHYCAIEWIDVVAIGLYARGVSVLDRAFTLLLSTTTSASETLAVCDVPSTVQPESEAAGEINEVNGERDKQTWHLLACKGIEWGLLEIVCGARRHIRVLCTLDPFAQTPDGGGIKGENLGYLRDHIDRSIHHGRPEILARLFDEIQAHHPEACNQEFAQHLWSLACSVDHEAVIRVLFERVDEFRASVDRPSPLGAALDYRHERGRLLVEAVRDGRVDVVAAQDRRWSEPFFINVIERAALYGHSTLVLWMLDNIDRADDFSDDGGGGGDRERIPENDVMSMVAQAVISGAPHKAHALLERLEARGWVYGKLEIVRVVDNLCWALGHTDSIAVPCRFIIESASAALQWWGPPAVSRLAQWCLDSGVRPDFVDALVDARFDDAVLLLDRAHFSLPLAPVSRQTASAKRDCPDHPDAPSGPNNTKRTRKNEPLPLGTR